MSGEIANGSVGDVWVSRVTTVRVGDGPPMQLCLPAHRERAADVVNYEGKAASDSGEEVVRDKQEEVARPVALKIAHPLQVAVFDENGATTGVCSLAWMRTGT